MLILGDLACPSKAISTRLIEDMKSMGIFDNELILCNFEGLLAEKASLEDEKLFNVEDVLRAFTPGQTIFSLANNHTYDYPEYIEETERILNSRGFYTVGVRHEESLTPTVLTWRGIKYAFFAHCWDVYTRTNSNKINDISIVDNDYSTFVNAVAEYTQSHTEQRVICYFHWNYDFEKIPFPMHREIARFLAEAGVYSVVGGHSHVPQGGESINGCPVLYGLGNFFIPSDEYFGGALKYPKESLITTVLDIDDDTDDVSCYWLETDGENALSLIKTERFDEGSLINSYSPYRGMGDEEYVSYFKKYRTKKSLVPVFDRYEGVTAELKQLFAVIRIKLIKAIKG